MKNFFSQPIKPFNTKELAALYGVSARIFRNWIKPHFKWIGPKIGRYFTSLQVKMIFERLGEPGPDNE